MVKMNQIVFFFISNGDENTSETFGINGQYLAESLTGVAIGGWNGWCCVSSHQ
jgi:hypothetical protein